jgi:hypothetical protein
MAAATASSMVKAEVSSSTASSAILSGASLRPESRASRRRISARMPSKCGSLAAPANSLWRRAARTSGVAVTNSFAPRLRADHRADVAPVKHRAAGLGREAALAFDQAAAHRRHGCDDGGRLADLATAQAILGEGGLIEMGDDRGRGVGIVDIVAGIEHGARDHAVEQAGVEIGQA